MNPPTDSQSIELSITIAAKPETLFRFFSDPERFHVWMGQASNIDPRIGGELTVVHPPGPPAVGKIVEWVANQKIVFTWGQRGPSSMLAEESSRVIITLTPTDGGTIVKLQHIGLPAEHRPGTTMGWTYYLGQLSSAVWTSSMQGRLEPLVDAYIRAWSETDHGKRSKLLTECFAETGTFRDRYGFVNGRDALNMYIAGVQSMMPGSKIERSGPVEQCHAHIRYGWRGLLPSGQVMATGSNFCELDADGRMCRVIGFWDAPSAT